MFICALCDSYPILSDNIRLRLCLCEWKKKINGEKAHPQPFEWLGMVANGWEWQGMPE
jgi:hypothetical protein